MLVSEKQYWELHQRLDHASYTDLLAFEKNARVYSLSRKRKLMDAMIQGQLLDCLLLSPGDYEDRFEVRTEANAKGEVTLQTKAAKAEYARIMSSGKLPIHPKWLTEAEEAIASLMAPTATWPAPCDVLASGTGQVGIRQRFGNVWFLSKPDWAPDPNSDWGDYLIDVKRTEVDDMREWGSHVASYRYHWQAASQLDAWNTEFPETPRTKFAWLIVTKHDSGILEADPDDLALGREEYVHALTRYQSAFNAGEWPSPFHSSTQTPKTARLPDWYRRRAQ